MCPIQGSKIAHFYHKRPLFPCNVSPKTQKEPFLPTTLPQYPHFYNTVSTTQGSVNSVNLPVTPWLAPEVSMTLAKLNYLEL